MIIGIVTIYNLGRIEEDEVVNISNEDISGIDQVAGVGTPIKDSQIEKNVVIEKPLKKARCTT